MTSQDSKVGSSEESSSDQEQLTSFLNQTAKKRDLKAKRKIAAQDESSEQEYSFSPVFTGADRKVPINFTDLSKLQTELDTTKDVPLKKPQSAYVLFGNEQRLVIAQKYRGLKVTEVVKMIAKEWQKLNKCQRQKYKDAAKRDKERFSQELAKLSRVNDHSLLYQMPKKPLTAYMFFVRQTRVRIAKEMPDIPPLDIMKEVGKEWQRCLQKDLVKFKALAKLDDTRYQEEMQRFIQHLNSLRTTECAQHMSADAEGTPKMLTAGKDGSSTANITPVKMISGSPPHQHCQRPKKPLSAYIFYSQEQRDLLKRENPHLSTRDVMMQVSKQWSALEKTDRQFYMRMASDDKKRFEGQMQQLRSGLNPKLLTIEPITPIVVIPKILLSPGLQRFRSLQQNDSEIQELSPLLMHKHNDHHHNSLFEFDYNDANEKM